MHILERRRQAQAAVAEQEDKIAELTALQTSLRRRLAMMEAGEEEAEEEEEGEDVDYEHAEAPAAGDEEIEMQVPQPFPPPPGSTEHCEGMPLSPMAGGGAFVCALWPLSILRCASER